MPTLIFDNVSDYLTEGRKTYSASLYLGAGLQPHFLQAGEYVPMAEDAGVLSAEDTAALVQSCATP